MHRSRAVLSRWRNRGAFLPVRLERTTLRELKASDASSLVPLMLDPEVRRFLPNAPQTAEDVERYAWWAERHRRSARHVRLAITVREQAIGVIQAWPVEPMAQTIEWGFVLGRPYWGEGLFAESARAFISFAVGQLGVARIEARTAMPNDRASAALQRLGASCEGVLRQCFTLADTRVDCLMWSILASEWTPTSHAPHQ